MRSVFILVIALFVNLNSFYAQTSSVADSLLKVYAIEKNDIQKVNLLYEIGSEYELYDFGKAGESYKKALNLSKTIGYKVGEIF